MLVMVLSVQAGPQPASHDVLGLLWEQAQPGTFYLFIFLRYAGLSLLRPLPLRDTGSGRAGSAAMALGPSRSAACGIFPDRGTNPRPLNRQADSQPLRHQGSPLVYSLDLCIYTPTHAYTHKHTSEILRVQLQTTTIK